MYTPSAIHFQPLNSPGFCRLRSDASAAANEAREVPADLVYDLILGDEVDALHLGPTPLTIASTQLWRGLNRPDRSRDATHYIASMSSLQPAVPLSQRWSPRPSPSPVPLPSLARRGRHQTASHGPLPTPHVCNEPLLPESVRWGLVYLQTFQSVGGHSPKF